MSDCFLFRSEDLSSSLSTQNIPGKRQLEPLKNLFISREIPFGLMEDCGIPINQTNSEIHTQEGDLWYCVEGEADFIYGGEIVGVFDQPKSNGQELGGASISGGTKVKIRKGDWLWIPAGVPHMHGAEKLARLIIIKIPQKK